jgi:putative FmdB family regulatory protein
MPLYEYACKECGIRFERTQSFNDAPLTVCPECEGEVHRVIGATGVIFKGSGFYVTDNRKSSNGSSHRSSSKGENKGESTASAESAPAATASASTEN